MKPLQIQVPATAANLGPGFDALGLALNLHNEVTVETTDSGLEIQVEGEGEKRLPGNASNLIARAAYRLFRTVDASPPGMRFRCVNRIPLRSGLGSSAAAVVCGLMAADALAESGLSKEQLLEQAWEMEGHADNAAAAIFGGLTIVGQGLGRLITAQVPIAPIRLAVIVPEIRSPTRELRNALPRNVPLRDAAVNIGHSGLMLEALRHGDFELLSHAAQDRLHEPYRAPLIPGYEEARSAGLDAGAAAVTLSGAGPGLIAFSPDRHEAIAEAMADAFGSLDLSARTYLLEPEPQGVRLLG